MKRYYVYIIYSESVDRYYIGSSSDLEDRLRRHNSAHRGFTAIAQDWIIVYQEVFASNSEALKREKEIKSKKSRKYIEALISGSAGSGA